MSDGRSQPDEYLTERSTAKIAAAASDQFEREAFAHGDVVGALSEMKLGEWTKMKALVRRAVCSSIAEHVRIR